MDRQARKLQAGVAEEADRLVDENANAGSRSRTRCRSLSLALALSLSLSLSQNFTEKTLEPYLASLIR